MSLFKKNPKVTNVEQSIRKTTLKIGQRTFPIPPAAVLSNQESETAAASSVRQVFQLFRTAVVGGAFSNLVVQSTFQVTRQARIRKVYGFAYKLDSTNAFTQLALASSFQGPNIVPPPPVVSASSFRNFLYHLAPVGNVINVDYNENDSVVLFSGQNYTIDTTIYGTMAATDTYTIALQFEVEYF
jgi:hypothetical protein